MKKIQGFTLIELLVVVLIIGILSAVALPQYTRAVEKARLTEPITLMASIQKGIDVYKLSHRATTTTHIDMFDVIDVDVQNGLNCSGNSCSSKYYVYEAYCQVPSPCECEIYADRYEPGSGGGNSNRLWELHYCLIDKRWIREYDTYTDEGKKLLKSLQSQGWTEC